MKLYFTLLIIGFSVSIKAQDVVRTNTELVQTAVTVVDKKGHFVEGLQREGAELLRRRVPEGLEPYWERSHCDGPTAHVV